MPLPPPVITVDAATRLRPWTEADVPVLFDAVDASRDHIAQWLPWADGYTPERAAEFVQRVRAAYESGPNMELALEVGGAVAGGCGYVRLDAEHREGEIGYWIGLPYARRGVMTRAVAALTTYGFEAMDLHRVVIAALGGNVRSRAIPERLGFRFEGLFKEARWHRGEFHDIAWYATSEEEWRSSPHHVA